MKRATYAILMTASVAIYFNPRPREEGDSVWSLILTYQNYFNPRPREEGDFSVVKVVVDCVISIHALVKRATDEDKNMAKTYYISIHALVKRATSVYL